MFKVNTSSSRKSQKKNARRETRTSSVNQGGSLPSRENTFGIECARVRAEKKKSVDPIIYIDIYKYKYI